MTNTEKLRFEGALLLLHQENCFIAEALMRMNGINEEQCKSLIKGWDERMNEFLGGCK